VEHQEQVGHQGLAVVQDLQVVVELQVHRALRDLVVLQVQVEALDQQDQVVLQVPLELMVYQVV